MFGDKQTGRHLLKFQWFPIERHALVKGTASPDDPCLKEYWIKRQEAKSRDLTFSKQKIADRQQGRCLQCGETLFNEEEVHIHHLLARSLGGKDTYGNLVLVHMLCHQQIHAKIERAISDCQQHDDRYLLEQEKQLNRHSKRDEHQEQCCS